MGIAISNIFSTYQVAAPANRSSSIQRMSRAEEKRDMVALSTRAKDYQAIRRVLANTPDIRTETVNPIKARIEADTYDVSVEMLADKLLGNK